MPPDIPDRPGARPAAGQLAGGCLCGGVRYLLDPGPGGSIGRVTLCHCRQCQKVSGGPAWASISTPLEGIALTESRGLRWFASSDRADRGFCAGCGAALFWAPVGEARLCLSPAQLDTLPACDATEHIFTESAADYAAPEGPPAAPDPDPPAAPEGGCLCGANRFRLRSPAGPATACHCRQCARVSGHYAVSFDAADGLDWLRSDSLAHHFGPGGGRRSFCATCGSPMVFARDGAVSVEAGALPARTGGRLERHIHTESLGSWHRPDDGLPRHPVED